MSADTPNINNFDLFELEDSRISTSGESTLIEDLSKNMKDPFLNDMMLGHDWMEDILTPVADNNNNNNNNSNSSWYDNQTTVELVVSAVQSFVAGKKNGTLSPLEGIRPYVYGFLSSRDQVSQQELADILGYMDQSGQRIPRLEVLNALLNELQPLKTEHLTPMSDSSTIPDLEDISRRKQVAHRSSSTANSPQDTDDKYAQLSRVWMRFEPFERQNQGFSLAQYSQISGWQYTDRGSFAESVKAKKLQTENRTLVTILKTMYKANAASTILRANIPVDLAAASQGVDLEIGKFISYADVLLDIGHFLNPPSQQTNFSRMLSLKSVVTVYEGETLMMRKTESLSAVFEGPEVETTNNIRLALPLNAKYWSALVTSFQNGAVEALKCENVLITHSVFLDDDACGRVNMSRKHVPILVTFWEFSLFAKDNSVLRYSVLRPNTSKVDFTVPTSRTSQHHGWPESTFSRGHKRVRSRSLGNLDESRASAALRSSCFRESSPSANPPDMFSSFSDRGSPMPSPTSPFDLHSRQQFLLQQYQFQVKEAQLRLLQAQAQMQQEAPPAVRPGIFRTTSYSPASPGLGLGLPEQHSPAEAPTATKKTIKRNSVARLNSFSSSFSPRAHQFPKMQQKTQKSAPQSELTIQFYNPTN